MLLGLRFLYGVAVSWKCDFEQPSHKNTRFFILGKLFFSWFWLPFSRWFPRGLVRRSFSRFCKDLGAKLASKWPPKTGKNRFESQLNFLRVFLKLSRANLSEKSTPTVPKTWDGGKRKAQVNFVSLVSVESNRSGSKFTWVIGNNRSGSKGIYIRRRVLPDFYCISGNAF